MNSAETSASSPCREPHHRSFPALSSLPEIKAQAARAPLSAQEESDLIPAMTLFNTPLVIQKHRADLHIYNYGGLPGLFQTQTGQ